nr:hypothetical protein [Patescibacteria group bacterium]
DEQLRQAERKQLGYYARPEGIALDLDHFLLDAIQEVNAEVENTELQKNKKGKIKETDLRRGRNYDHPERFRRAEDLKNYLATQDRFYREAQVLDPLKKTEDGIAKTEVFSSRLENLESDILKINIQRAEVLLLLPTLRSELAQLSLQTEASPTNTRHRSELQKQVATLEGLSRELQLLPLEDQLHTLPEDAVAARSVIQKRIKSLPISLPHIQKTTDAISELRIEKTRVIEAEKNPQQKRQIASEFDERIKENMKQLVQYYKQAMGGEQEWGKFARRTTRIIEQNRIKFIYVVKADGTILTDEEKLRGVAVTGRAAHSELAQGENIYGGGELAFDKQDDGSWNLVEINNGSGHFRPDSSTLFYVKNVLEKKGINTSHAILRDSLQRGASPPDLSLSE